MTEPESRGLAALDPGHPPAGSPEVGRAYYGPATFELRQSSRAYRWSVEVGFLAGASDADESPAPITLGHVGFFRDFRAAFDHQRNRVEIRPNGLFSRVAERGNRKS